MNVSDVAAVVYAQKKWVIRFGLDTSWFAAHVGCADATEVVDGLTIDA